MRLFYQEAKQLATKTTKVHEEIQVIAVKKDSKQDYDLNVIRLQRALKKTYEEGYQKGLKDGMKKLNDTDEQPTK